MRLSAREYQAVGRNYAYLPWLIWPNRINDPLHA